MPKAYCKQGNHYPEVLIAGVYGINRDGEIELTGQVQLNNEGKCNNFWADGILGVPEHIQKLAEEDESPLCYEHKCEITWNLYNAITEHTYTT